MDDQTQPLEKLVQDWAAAELRGDTAFLRHALTDDFVGVGPRGFVLRKEEWLERHASGKLRYESFRLDEVQLRVYRESAVLTGRETANAKYESYIIRDQFRATLVLVKQQGHWLLASLHLSPIAGVP